METKNIPLTRKEYLWLLDRRFHRKNRHRALIFLLLFTSFFFLIFSVIPEGPRGVFIGILLGVFLTIWLVYLIWADRIVRKMVKDWDNEHI